MRKLIALGALGGDGIQIRKRRKFLRCFKSLAKFLAIQHDGVLARIGGEQIQTTVAINVGHGEVALFILRIIEGHGLNAGLAITGALNGGLHQFAEHQSLAGLLDERQHRLLVAGQVQ